jgi:hypothetical protein
MDGCGGCVGFLVTIAMIIGVIWGAIWLITKAVEDAKIERAADASRRAAEEAERQRDLHQQNRFRQQIFSVNEEALKSFEQVPRMLAAAEQHLDQAERDFAEGAFAPFWDSVEKAANALGSVESNATAIKDRSVTYIDLVKQYRGAVPLFAVSRQSAPRLKIASETSKRMNEVVRKAQRNFQFSVIYEQRKTNQVLVAGFRTLANALDEMTWRITSSLDDLTRSVDSMSSTLNESLREMSAKAEALRDDFVNDTAKRTEREEKALEMLDNIQRKRYPNYIHGGVR